MSSQFKLEKVRTKQTKKTCFLFKRDLFYDINACLEKILTKHLKIFIFLYFPHFLRKKKTFFIEFFGKLLRQNFIQIYFILDCLMGLFIFLKLIAQAPNFFLKRLSCTKLTITFFPEKYLSCKDFWVLIADCTWSNFTQMLPSLSGSKMIFRTSP